MRTGWMGAISLGLSVITLAVVLSIAARPAPLTVDPGPALSGLRTDVAEVRAAIASVQAVVEKPTASAGIDGLAAIQARLDSLDSAVSAIAAKFTALCTAINASPISPPGGAC